jgi:regulator of replication initiation timing
MKDDIETLRDICNQVVDDEPRKQALSALDRLQARVAQLEQWKSTLHKQVDDYAERYVQEGHKVKAFRSERDSLRKSLDERFAADQRAAKAIFAETGRSSGFPSVKEIVAYYITEAELLKIESAGRLATWADCRELLVAERRENGSLRVKLERAKEALEPFASLSVPEYVPDDALLVLTTINGGIIDTKETVTAGAIRTARVVLVELSGVAPAQQTPD